MATVKFDLSREGAYYDVAQSAGGAISNEIRVTFEDSLTKDEMVILLEKVKEFVTREDAI